ncbi:MAG: LruC domain-containing protein [Bacteroidales bacterium]|nr:LruC domain-containing protein [Bacteroidales bacterium]
MKTNWIVGGIIALFFIFSGCQKSDDNPDPNGEIDKMEDLVISDNFNFRTTQEVTFRVAVSQNDNALKNAPVDIYNKPPQEQGELLLSGSTNENGIYNTVYPVPTYYEEVFVKVNQLGLPNQKRVAIEGSQVDVTFGTPARKAPTTKQTITPKAADFEYPVTYLGTFDSEGVPDYLVEDDEVGQDFMDDLNNTLPEAVPLSESHPEYLDQENEQDLILDEMAEVWVTFVHEGAALKNTLGFYTYEVGNPPSSVSDIDSLTIIFPNVSYEGDGGGLETGNKVKLGVFDANTAIGWALIANGWSAGQVNDRTTFYSNEDFNPEDDPQLRQHTVLLNDPMRERFIIGFEDLQRDVWSDEDFNDAVFYATTNPYEATNTDNVPNIDNDDPDVDGDGVPNDQDDFPNDPDRAYKNNYEGSLAYEDLWPGKGDYDFNDIVVDYHLEQVTNSSNEVTAINGRFILKAFGAAHHNGFGFEMNVNPSQIASVEGTAVNSDYINLAGNGLEANQQNAVVIVFDDAYDILDSPGGGIGVNTEPDAPYVEPDTINISIDFNTPEAITSLQTPPYNPFIISDKRRGYEIHLPDREPTDLIDSDLLGDLHDDSNPAENRYFKTQENLPWGINIAEPFDYPVEKVEILNAHLKFAEWAQSGGTAFPDWYKDEPGYRNDDNIYPIPE